MFEFKIPADVLSEMAEAAALVASTDESRLAICQVHVHSPEKDVLEFTATDSYRLVRLTFSDAEYSFEDIDFLTPAKAFADAVKQFRSAKKSDAKIISTVTVAAVDDQSPITVSDGLSTIQLQRAFYDFPNVDRLIDWDNPLHESTECVGFNPKYLADIGKVASKFRGDNSDMPVRVHGVHHNKPSLFEMKRAACIGDHYNVRVRYLLMPVRIA